MKTVLVCVWLVNSLIHIISGCSLFAPKEVTGYTGGSVVLPCYCTDGRPILNSARWLLNPGASHINLGPREVDDPYKDRVQHYNTPGNLSLVLLRLTESDEGTYRCEGDGQHKDIKLSVKGVVPTTQNPATTKQTFTHGSTKTTISEGQARVKTLATTLAIPEQTSKHGSTKTTGTKTKAPVQEEDDTYLYVTIAVAATVTSLAVCGALFYCRYRARKRVESREQKEMATRKQEQEQGQGQERQDADSVTYSAINHSKAAKKTNIQLKSEDCTEYAAITFGIPS